MKRILVLLLFLTSLVHAGSTSHVITTFIAPSAGGCESCNTGNDSEIITAGNTNDSTFASTAMRAWQFTAGADVCVTGVQISASDGGNGYDLICQIWSDNSGEPGSIVGAGFTGTYSNLPDTDTAIEVTFAATQELSAGTYWVVYGSQMTLGVAGDSITYGVNASGSGIFMYDAAGTWTTTGYELDIGVLGCTP
jgi:hypothetical protein